MAMTPKGILEVPVNLKLWRTGRDSRYKTGRGRTALLNEEGFMCCLGFACLAAGALDSDIMGIGTPSSVRKDLMGVNTSPLGRLPPRDSPFILEAIRINDSARTKRETKQKRLEALGKKHGVKWIWQ